MSKIITIDYYNKLGVILGAKKMPNSIIDFFLKEIEHDQEKRVKRKQVFSRKALENVRNFCALENLYPYLHIVVNAFQKHYLHLHINQDLTPDIKNNIITVFAWDLLMNASYDTSSLKHEIMELEQEIKPPINLGEGGGDENSLYKKRYGKKHRLKLLKKTDLINSESINKGTLLNLNNGMRSSVDFSEFSTFPPSLNTYINFGETLQDVYTKNNLVLEKIHTVINLFPAERGRSIWYYDFLMENIEKWNQLPNYAFDKVITITCGRKTADDLIRMQRENKFQSQETYIVFPFEL